VKTCKKEQFSEWLWWGGRRYADHIFIQIYFRMHHFVDKIFKMFFSLGEKGALTFLTKILQTLLFAGKSEGSDSEPELSGDGSYTV